MTTQQLLRLYRSRQAVSLATWLGNPISSAEAGSCQELMRHLSHDRWTHQAEYFNQRMGQMIARYWMGQGADMHYSNLVATVGSTRDKAQLELCYGQLLIARKLANAWRHLDAGFAAAANLLQPEEYFIVLNRHESLRSLVLSPNAANADGLDELLKEAGVIRQLQGNQPGYWSGASQHQDTVD